MPVIDTCVEDTRFCELVNLKHGYDPNYGCMEFLRLKQAYGFGFKEIKMVMEDHLGTFKSSFSDRRMIIDVETFSRVSGMDIENLKNSYFKGVKYFDGQQVTMPVAVEAALRAKKMKNL